LSVPKPSRPFPTGRRIGLSPPKRLVAGSSPASGSNIGRVQTRRSSSAVEHVFPVRFLSVVISAGRRLWVLVNPAIPVQIRSAACGGGATFSTPGNSTVALLPALILMGRRHRVICHWFESNLLHQMGQ